MRIVRLRNGWDSFKGRQGMDASFCLCGCVEKSNFLSLRNEKLIMEKRILEVVDYFLHQNLMSFKNSISHRKAHVNTWNMVHSRQI